MNRYELKSWAESKLLPFHLTRRLKCERANKLDVDLAISLDIIFVPPRLRRERCWRWQTRAQVVLAS
jgi:hypothetical protein